MNVLCLGARVIGEQRHRRRLAKIAALEDRHQGTPWPR
jgi:ribose 5-phosphate isomerase RpiB